MLNAQFKLSSVVDSNLSNQKLVTVGVAITEDDSLLTSEYVAGSIVWGDGSRDYVIPATAVRYNQISTPTLVVANNLVTLTLVPAPYTGTFKLLYNSSIQINGLAWDIPALTLQDQLQTAIGLDIDAQQKVVSVTGASPTWQILFKTSGFANLLAAGIGSSIFGLTQIPAHPYPIGNFTAQLVAKNLRSPTPDTVTVALPINLAPATPEKQKQPVIFGPILPTDVGFPNPSQWSFDSATDVKLLASSVKMILITQPGERVMMPDYGCLVKQYIFDPNDTKTQNDILKEVQRAITTWEPRVDIESINTQKTERSATLQISLISKLDRERFQLNVEFER